MSDFKINSIENKNGNYGPVIAGVSSVNSNGCMTIPSGTTARRVEYIPQSENIVRDGGRCKDNKELAERCERLSKAYDYFLD